MQVTMFGRVDDINNYYVLLKRRYGDKCHLSGSVRTSISTGKAFVELDISGFFNNSILPSGYDAVGLEITYELYPYKFVVYKSENSTQLIQRQYSLNRTSTIGDFEEVSTYEERAI